MPIAALLVATTVPAPASAAATLGPAIAPFETCPNYGYMVTLPPDSGRSTYNRYDISTATLIPIKQFDFVVNAIGYSKTQNVFWGLHSKGSGPDSVVRFDSVGNLDEVGVPTVGGVPATTFEAVAGTVDGDKLIVHTREPANHIWTIDVNPSSPTFGSRLSDVTVSRATGTLSYLNVGDWDLNDQDGLLYAIELSPQFRKVVTIDPATGAVADRADVSADLPDSDNYGAAFVEDGQNNFYVSANNIKSGGTPTGQSQTFMLRMSFSPPLVTAYAKGEGLRVNDGGDCLLATDFGDAPDSYGTLDKSGGPAHVLSSYLHKGQRLRIGTQIDADLDGFFDKSATADDDNVPSMNDEDGLPAGSKIAVNAPTVTVPITNTTGGPATLAGWLDANVDGQFTENERAMVSLGASATKATLTWPAFKLPAKTATFLRMRIYEGDSFGVTGAHTAVAQTAGARPAGARAGGPQPGGWVDGGEVEDHEVTLVQTATRPNPVVAEPPAAGPPAPAAGPTGDLPPATRDWDDDGDIDYQDAVLAATGTSLRPYLLLGVGMVLIGLALLAGVVLLGSGKVRRKPRPPASSPRSVR